MSITNDTMNDEELTALSHALTSIAAEEVKTGAVRRKLRNLRAQFGRPKYDQAHVDRDADSLLKSIYLHNNPNQIDRTK